MSFVPWRVYNPKIKLLSVCWTVNNPVLTHLHYYVCPVTYSDEFSICFVIPWYFRGQMCSSVARIRWWPMLTYTLPAILDWGLGMTGRCTFVLNAGFAVCMRMMDFVCSSWATLCHPVVKRGGDSKFSPCVVGVIVLLSAAKCSESGVVSSRRCRGSFRRKVCLKVLHQDKCVCSDTTEMNIRRMCKYRPSW